MAMKIILLGMLSDTALSSSGTVQAYSEHHKFASKYTRICTCRFLSLLIFGKAATARQRLVPVQA